MAVEAVERTAPGRARLLAATAIGVLLLAASRYAYYRIFGQFAEYDDEGYVMQTVRSYLSGAPLYDEVYSQYGPAFYVWQWIVHGLLRAPLDHDTVRLFTIAYWLAAAGLSGVIVFRLTRSVLVCGLSVVLVFIHLAPLINEPGHPQAVLTVTVLLACAIVADASRLPTARRAACCGALVAFATLVKVNVGAYLLLGLALPLVIASPGTRVFGWMLLAIAASAPVLIMRAHLGSYGYPYAAAVSAGVLSIGLTIDRTLRGAVADRRVLQAFCLSGAATGVLLLAPAFIGGTSLAALVRTVVVEPSRFATVFFMPAILPDRTPVVALLALLAGAAFLIRRIAESQPARVLVAIAKVASVLLVLPTSQGGHAAQIGYATPFLWLLLMTPDRTPGAAALFARAALACVGALQTLQAYPVAGSQVSLATVPIAIAVLIALDDGLKVLAAILKFPLAHTALRAACVSAAVYLSWLAIPGESWRYAYRTGYGLRLPGAERLRLTRDEVARYQWLAGSAGTNCETLQTVPGLYSLNAWSGVAAPTHANATAWLTLLPAGQRERIWTAAASNPHACIIVNRELASNWLGPQLLSSTGIDLQLSRFVATAAAGGYELLAAPRAGNAPDIALLAGRQSFTRGRTPLPIDSRLLLGPAESTVRAWIRTRRTGVIVGCQSLDRLVGRPPISAPLIYVGRSGRIVAQYLSGGDPAEPAGKAVNDGEWHHVALVRRPDAQHVYVDGAPVRSAGGDVPAQAIENCQVGVGFTMGSPDASEGWMAFTGDVEGLRVAPRAWDAAHVEAEWRTSRPAERD